MPPAPDRARERVLSALAGHGFGKMAGTLVSLRHLRGAVGRHLSEKEANAALLSLAADGKVELHPLPADGGGPDALHPLDRAALLTGPDGTRYTSASVVRQLHAREAWARPLAAYVRGELSEDDLASALATEPRRGLFGFPIPD